MEDMDSQMLTLKQQGAAARGYKGHLTKVTKSMERAKELSNTATFQEAQACNDNLNRQLQPLHERGSVYEREEATRRSQLSPL